MKTVTLKKNQDKRVRAGHPWIFSNEIARLSQPAETGEEVTVINNQKQLIGRGFYHPHSLIAVRLITRVDEPIDKNLFIRKLRNAWEYRKKIYPGDRSYRLFFGESDGISGLVIDKYNEVLVLQIFSAGIEKRKALVKESLQEVFQPKTILARNDFPIRKQEGLDQGKEIWEGELPEELWIEQDGIRFFVDVWNGQKTGFFFDQRENRLAVQKYIRGGKVLDCFTYTGGFGLYAARGGAHSVVGIDSAAEALSVAEKNSSQNQLDAIYKTNKADVFNFLKEDPEKYDAIILDPPALAKNKSALTEAMSGYRNLNRRALEKLESGGTLVTCSCSYHVSEDAFKEMLIQAAQQAGCEIQLLEWRSQSRDHPVLLAARETEYLKCVILRKI